MDEIEYRLAQQDLLRLLEEKAMSSFERRKRRLAAIPMEVVTTALQKARAGEPLNRQEFMASHLGFLPGELAAEGGRSVSTTESAR